MTSNRSVKVWGFIVGFLLMMIACSVKAEMPAATESQKSGWVAANKVSGNPAISAFFKKGEILEGSGQYVWYWRFESNSPNAVKFTYNVIDERKGHRTLAVAIRWTIELRPNEKQSFDTSRLGQHATAEKLMEVKILSSNPPPAALQKAEGENLPRADAATKRPQKKLPTCTMISWDYPRNSCICPPGTSVSLGKDNRGPTMLCFNSK